MTQPLDRDELARDLYVNDPDDPDATARMRESFAAEWDEGMVPHRDRAACYARADRVIAEGAKR